jgi:hypothetical protein
MITMGMSAEQNQGDSPIQTSAREEEHHGSAGLAFAQRSPAAGDPGVRSDSAAFPLSGSPVRPNDIAQEPEFLPRSSVRNGNPGDMNQICTGFNRTGRRAEVAAQEQTANLTRLGPSLDAARSPAVAGGEDVALRGNLGDAPQLG